MNRSSRFSPSYQLWSLFWVNDSSKAAVVLASTTRLHTGKTWFTWQSLKISFVVIPRKNRSCPFYCPYSKCGRPNKELPISTRLVVNRASAFGQANAPSGWSLAYFTIFVWFQYLQCHDGWYQFCSIYLQCNLEFDVSCLRDKLHSSLVVSHDRTTIKNLPWFHNSLYKNYCPLYLFLDIKTQQQHL